MSPKYFKNINHPEQEIRMNNVSGHGQMNEGQTQPLLELTPRGDWKCYTEKSSAQQVKPQVSSAFAWIKFSSVQQ